MTDPNWTSIEEVCAEIRLYGHRDPQPYQRWATNIEREMDRRFEQCSRHLSITDRQIRELRAERERLRGLLKEARDDIHEEVEALYPPESRHYPSVMRRYQREMDLVNRIDAALDATNKEPLK